MNDDALFFEPPTITNSPLLSLNIASTIDRIPGNVVFDFKLKFLSYLSTINFSSFIFAFVPWYKQQ